MPTAFVVVLLAGGTLVSQRDSRPEEKPLSEREPLQVKISFVCRAQPLERVVADLAKDTGVSLGLDDPVRKRALKLTARVEDLPLWQVMQALEELFQGQWRENPAAYVLSELPRSALERDLFRLGDPDWASYNLGGRDYEEKKRIANEIYESFTPQQRQAALKEGVPFSSLPEEQRRRLARALDQSEGLRRLIRLRRALPEALGRCVLKATVPKLPAKYARYQDSVAPDISVMQGGYRVAPLPLFFQDGGPRSGRGTKPAR